MQRTPRTRVGLILTVAAGLGASSFAIGGLTSTTSLADGPVDRSVRFVATQDAFGSSLRPNLRRATIDHLVARDTRGVSKVSYLKFTVTRSALGPGGVVGAKLLLTPRASMRVPIQVRLVHRNDWSERFLTYNNAPREGTVVGLVRPGPTTTPRWIDVSQVVTKPGTYSFSLTAAKGTARFASAESNRPPTLIVRVKKGGSGSTTPTTTSSPTPTASGTTQAPTEAATTPAPVTSSPTAPQTVTADPTTASRGCAQRFPGDPCTGRMYYGASVEGGDPRTLESQIGHTITMFRSYMQPTSSASKFASRAATDVAAGRIPMISTKVPGTWADLAAGKQDPWLIERVKALATVNGPVWLALHHEPRGDGSPADWVAMQQHARTIIDQYAPNVALVGILNGWDFEVRGGNPEAYWMPIGTGVDIMGFDSYNPWSPTDGKAWKSVQDTLAPGLAIQKWGYPTMVAEYGVRTDSSNPGRAAQWMSDFYDYALAHDFLGISYFDSSANSADGTWELTGERLNQFATNLTRAETASLAR